MTELPVGSTLAGLRIEAVLGRGGMGVVYLAFDPELDRRVAVKVIAGELAADPDFRRRFRRESRTAASVHHPHVIPIHRAGDEDGQLFLVMHYVAGPDLRDLIQESGRLEPQLVATVITQVAGALDAAHRRDLVHRDVKPANILVARDGDAPHAYLTDFGLTRRSNPTDPITGTGALLGSLDYMAPELFDQGPASVASDVYALGCVAYHALSGSVVHPRDNMGAVVAAHLHAAAPTLGTAVPDPGLRAALDAVVATALAKRPKQRYPSAGALAAALRSAVDGAGGPPGPAGGASPESQHAARPTITQLPAVVPVPAQDVPTVTAPPIEAVRFTPPVEPVTPEPPTGPAAPPSPVRFTPPDEPDPARHTADPPPESRRRTRRASAVLLLAAVATVAIVTVAALLQPGQPAGPVIVLGPPVDNGSSVRLSWTGPPTLDYGIEVSTGADPPATVLAHRSTTLAVDVLPGTAYCFRVRGTDGQTFYTSNVQSLRGASCGS